MSYYRLLEPDEWEQPVHQDYKFRCCDCGLVHRMDFRVVNQDGESAVEFRLRRDNRATAANRRVDR